MESRCTSLRTLIDSRGIKHSWLARRLGRSSAWLSHILSGKRRLPADKAEELARLLSVPTEEVLLAAARGNSGEDKRGAQR